MKHISLRNIIVYGLIAILLGTLVMLFVSTRPAPRPEVTREPVGNFDAETQAMIASAKRVVFIIPFSHVVRSDSTGHRRLCDFFTGVGARK